MTIQEKIGLKIKNLRLSKKLSQEELAQKIGYKEKSSVAKIESGKIDLPQSKIVAIAKVLGTTPSYLMEGDEEIDKESSLDNLQVKTIAAHFEAEEFTETEIQDIENYIEFVKSRKNKDDN